MIRRFYADGRFGQVHCRENTRIAGTPLVCLHATAYSSRSFGALLAALDGVRHVIAADTPGYGESDPPPDVVSVADYAAAVAGALPATFDLFGYHTGVAIAAEMAIALPARVGALTFMGVPYFAALDFESWRARLAARHRLGTGLDQFAERWEFLVTNRPAGLPLRRAFENFVDELKAWPDGWWAHEALFAADLGSRLGLVRQPVTILNPGGHLAEPSRQAARLMRDATVVELPDVSGAVLDTHAAMIAEHCREREAAAV